MPDAALSQILFFIIRSKFQKSSESPNSASLARTIASRASRKASARSRLPEARASSPYASRMHRSACRFSFCHWSPRPARADRKGFFSRINAGSAR